MLPVSIKVAFQPAQLGYPKYLYLDPVKIKARKQKMDVAGP
jgi:hypothetical protein